MNGRSLRSLAARLLPGESEQERNFWNLYAEVACWGFMFGINSTFLSVYTLRLGASNEVMGWFTAIPSLVFALWSIPAAGIIERVTNRRIFIATNGALYRSCVMLFALVPFALGQFRAEAIVAIVAIMTVPQAMSNISFSAMFADVVPQAYRTRVVSGRSMLSGFTSTLGSFIGGLFLGLTPAVFGGIAAPLFSFPGNFQAMFAVACFVGMGSIVFQLHLRTHDERVKTPARRQSLLSPRGFVDLMRRGPLFSRYALGMFIFHWGVYLPQPLYTIYWVRNLGASDTFIGLMLTVQSLVSVTVVAMLPRLSRRLDTVKMLWLGAFFTAAYPLLTALTTTLEPLMLISALGGFGSAFFGVSTFNFLLEVAPAEQRPSYIAVYNTALFSAGFMAPFVGTALLGVMDINSDMLIGAALRFAGLFALVFLVGTGGRRAAEHAA